MSRSRFPLRRTLAGVFFAGCMAFGSAQAFGAPRAAALVPIACNRFDQFAFEYCTEKCQEAGYDYGLCGYTGYCTCRMMRPAG